MRTSVCYRIRAGLCLQQPLTQEHKCRNSWPALRLYSRWAAALALKRPARCFKFKCPSPPLDRGTLANDGCVSACRLGIRRALCSAADVNGQTDGYRREEPSFRAYIDFQALKANLPRHIQNVKDRNSDARPEKVVQLYDEWSHLLLEVERLRAERKAKARDMKVRGLHRQYVSLILFLLML